MHKPISHTNLLRFSDFFGIQKSQAELDFVDIPLDTDIKIFLDPYALNVGKTEWFAEANDLIVDFFEHLMESIRAGDQLESVRLLANLREPNDARLGLCKGRPEGRGIGVKQADELYRRFRSSKAVQTGLLKDITECELLIPGISSDKISDITINIIRPLLVSYTQQQCQLWGVPMSLVETGVGWDAGQKAWVNWYDLLPTYLGQRILLIPKAAVRRRLEFNHEDYLGSEVIPFLMAEEVRANTGLVKTLRDGRKKVLRKEIEEKYFRDSGMHVKDTLFSISERHPELLERYKASKQNPHPLNDYELEEAQNEVRELNIRRLETELVGIKLGALNAARYHNQCIGYITTIFGTNLLNPKKEQPIHEGRKRIDITYNNAAISGFFHDLQTKHGIKSPYVFVECKNYSSDAANPELDQLTGRFSRERGEFGLLICRTILDEDLMLRRCRDIFRDGRGFVLILTDEDLINLSRLSARCEYAAIDQYMQRKLDKLLLG